MRRLFLSSLILIAVGCGPGAQVDDRLLTAQSVPERATPTARMVEDENRERLEDLDREISTLEGTIQDQDPYVEADLNERIARDREMIAALNMEAELERATQADSLRILQSRQEQESDLLRDRLATLADRVRAEEQAFAERQRNFSMLVAPEDTDLIRNGRAELLAGKMRLENARSEYESLLAEYNSTPAASFADQSRQLDTWRSRQGEFAAMIAATQADLNQAIQAKNQMAEERQARARQLDSLRSTRARLSAGTQQTGPTE